MSQTAMPGRQKYYRLPQVGSWTELEIIHSDKLIPSPNFYNSEKSKFRLDFRPAQEPIESRTRFSK